MARPRRSDAPSSRDRLLSAAAAEFAARGFDGAKVDRIAKRARVNKAMLYYHFASKAALYREILRDVFGSVAAAVGQVHESAAPPDQQLRQFIEAIAGIAVDRPHFPSMWLREMAEGGRHLDESVVAELARIMQTLMAILRDGVARGTFRAVPPFLAQIGIVGPLLLFRVTAPIRERFAHLAPFPVAPLEHDDVVEYVRTMTLSALSAQHPPAKAAQLTGRSR